MHKPWSKCNPLTDLLRDEEKTIGTFMTMIQERKLPYYVMSEFNCDIKYSQQWQYECVTKQITPNNTINLEDLDQQEREDLIHWEHSRHLSAQNKMNLDDHVGELHVDLRIDHDWTTKYFKYK